MGGGQCREGLVFLRLGTVCAHRRFCFGFFPFRGACVLLYDGLSFPFDLLEMLRFRERNSFLFLDGPGLEINRWDFSLVLRKESGGKKKERKKKSVF